jgi:predicted transcriptional regulator
MSRERFNGKKINYPVNRTPRGRQLSIKVRMRRKKLRKMLLTARMNQTDMARILGVTQATISQDIKFIFNEWLAEDIQETRAEIAFRIRQLDLAAKQAYAAFQRSKRDAEQINTEYERRPCRCKGRQRLGKKPCKLCGGTGERIVENVSKRVHGQAGDATLLRVYLDTIREANRIKGLYTAERREEKRVHMHLHTNVDMDRLTDEQLLAIKKAYTDNVLALPNESVMDVNSVPVTNED